MCTAWQVERADDDRLLHMLRTGCDAVLAEIERRYGAALRAHARRLLAGSSHDPDDAVQDTLMRAWSSLRSGGQDTRLVPWLHTVLRNRSLDLLRSAASRNVCLPDREVGTTGDVADDVLRREALRQLTEAVLGLPERQRKALVLHALAGDSHADIARRLDTTPASAKVLVHRARSRVRAAAMA